MEMFHFAEGEGVEEIKTSTDAQMSQRRNKSYKPEKFYWTQPFKKDERTT